MTENSFAMLQENIFGCSLKFHESLTEDLLLYDWVRPIEPPRYFNGGIFYDQGEDVVATDEEGNWHSIEYTTKFRNIHRLQGDSPKLDSIPTRALICLQRAWRAKRKTIGNAPLVVQAVQELKEESPKHQSVNGFNYETLKNNDIQTDNLSSDFGMACRMRSSFNNPSKRCLSPIPKDIEIAECAKSITPRDSILDFGEHIVKNMGCQKQKNNNMTKSLYSFGYFSNGSKTQSENQTQSQYESLQPAESTSSVGKKKTNSIRFKSSSSRRMTESSHTPLHTAEDEAQNVPNKSTTDSVAGSHVKEVCQSRQSLCELKLKLDESLRMESQKKEFCISDSPTTESCPLELLEKSPSKPGSVSSEVPRKLDFGSEKPEVKAQQPCIPIECFKTVSSSIDKSRSEKSLTISSQERQSIDTGLTSSVQPSVSFKKKHVPSKNITKNKGKPIEVVLVEEEDKPVKPTAASIPLKTEGRVSTTKSKLSPNSKTRTSVNVSPGRRSTTSHQSKRSVGKSEEKAGKEGKENKPAKETGIQRRRDGTHNATPLGEVNYNSNKASAATKKQKPSVASASKKSTISASTAISEKDTHQLTIKPSTCDKEVQTMLTGTEIDLLNVQFTKFAKMFEVGLAKQDIAAARRSEGHTSAGCNA